MSFIKICIILLIWLVSISFYLCAVVLVFIVDFFRSCICFTYCMFEYKTISLTKINQELDKVKRNLEERLKKKGSL